MRYRAILLNQDGTIPSEHLMLLTDQQLSKLALWSLQHNKSVLSLLTDARFTVEEEASGKTVLLEGMLPCGYYGAMLSDGTCHT
jgi:hypothetical protein